MRTPILAAIVAANAALSGCGRKSDVVAAPRTGVTLATLDHGQLSSDARLARDHAIDEFVWNALPDVPDRAPIASLRKPGHLPERVRMLDNEYEPGQKVEERTFVFDGLEVTGQVTAGGELRPWHAKVTRPEWRVRSGLRVGASVEAVVRVLGLPDEVKGDAIGYQGESEAVRFTIRDGRIAEVEVFVYHE